MCVNGYIRPGGRMASVSALSFWEADWNFVNVDVFFLQQNDIPGMSAEKRLRPYFMRTQPIILPRRDNIITKIFKQGRSQEGLPSIGAGFGVTSLFMHLWLIDWLIDWTNKVISVIVEVSDWLIDWLKAMRSIRTCQLVDCLISRIMRVLFLSYTLLYFYLYLFFHFVLLSFHTSQLVTALYSNYSGRHPIFSRTWRFVAFPILGYYLLGMSDYWITRFLSDRDAMMHHYISLHPEDFDEEAPPTLKHVLYPWYPVREHWDGVASPLQ